MPRTHPAGYADCSISQQVGVSEKENTTATPVVKENLTTETAATAKENSESEQRSGNGKSQAVVPETGKSFNKQSDDLLTTDEKVQKDIIKGNIGKYFSDVKDALRSLYKKAFTRNNLNRDFVNFAKIGDEERAILSQISGVDMSRATVHAIDESGIRHIDNRHGETETRDDQEPINVDDFVMIPEIIKGTKPKYLGININGNHVFQYQKK